MTMSTCGRCGFTPKNSSSLYFSAWNQQWQCIKSEPCQKRAAKRKGP